jgi:hypothetical protein
MRATSRSARKTKQAESRTRQTTRTVTLGELLSAAYEVGGSAESVATLLSPLSPLSRLLDKRIVVAGV